MSKVKIYTDKDCNHSVTFRVYGFHKKTYYLPFRNVVKENQALFFSIDDFHCIPNQDEVVQDLKKISRSGGFCLEYLSVRFKCNVLSVIRGVTSEGIKFVNCEALNTVNDPVDGNPELRSTRDKEI